ncbi:MAG: M28 family peptidase [Planctomycetes bacterium]|nr:M28 family peptidase [Planctomycetota bacterium]
MSVNLHQRLKAASELVSETSLLELVEMVWENDRQFTHPAYHATARKVGAKLREWGVRARTFEIPADGKTIFGDWRMPLGWSCKRARLEIYDPFEERGQVLADRKDKPCHTVMWSGPTPPEGITAEVILIRDRRDLAAKKDQVKGKILYTPSEPRSWKRQIVEAGALAVVTSWCRNAEHIPDAVFWFNGWSDNPMGWAFTAGDTPLPAMAISPAAGVELEVLMDRAKVKLKMVVDSEYMETTLPVVCGYIDAPLQEEILAIGHAQEQGANDNASGSAVILESLRVIHQGTQDGRLPPLKRAVRGLLTNECYGTVGFAAMNPGILRRIIAAVNWDTMGRHQEDADGGFRHHHCPDAVANVADTLMNLLLDEWFARKVPFHHFKRDQPFALTDNAYNDPQLGVFCTYVDSQDRFWHTSADTMNLISGRTLHAFATISVAYLHFLASATKEEAMWLAHQTVKRYGRRIEDAGGEWSARLESAEDKPALLALAYDELEYLKEIAFKAVMSAKRFMLREERAQGHLALLKLQRHVRRLVELEKRRLKELAGCEPGTLPPQDGLGEFAELRPLKKFIGTPTYDTIPKEAREAVGSPMWNSQLQCALFWCDGKLTLADIARRVNHEFERNGNDSLVEHFRLMGEHGLVQWLKPGEEIPKATKAEPRAEAESDGDAPAEDSPAETEEEAEAAPAE